MKENPNNHTYDNFFKFMSPDFNPGNIRENKVKSMNKFHFLQFVPVVLIIAAIVYFIFK